MDEVWDFIRGRAVTTDLKGLAALRRAEFDTYRREVKTQPGTASRRSVCPTTGTATGGPQPAAVGEDGVLRGIGCCPAW